MRDDSRCLAGGLRGSSSVELVGVVVLVRCGLVKWFGSMPRRAGFHPDFLVLLNFLDLVELLQILVGAPLNSFQWEAV